MVIDDFNVGRTARGPSETDSKLLIDSDAELTLPVALQGLEAVAGRDPEVFQDVGLVQLIQATPGTGPEIRRAGFRCGFGIGAVKNVLGASAAERLDHEKV